MKNKRLDPVTYQVIRNRLIAATEEMRIALQKVSGSPTVTEASDFFTGLFTADGAFITMGFQVTFAAAPISQSIRYLLKNYDGDINEGDMFAVNDPWIGALHQNDLQMVGPIFWRGKIVAWAGVMAHQTDIGGMDFASWCPDAREVYQEGLRIPGVKIVEKGRVRNDIINMILAASRLPAPLGLDIRAFIATINVASDRLSDGIGNFGLKNLNQVMERMLDVSEAQLKERLSSLPDAEIQAVNFIEHDGQENRLYRLHLKLTKKDSRLIFDFSKSSNQAPGFINCTRAGLHGAVIGSMMPILSWDLPWNAGLARPFEIIAPDGLVVTATKPAPVGAATVEAVWATAHLCMGAVNRLLACSPEFTDRVQAVSTGAMSTFNLAGLNQSGGRYGFHSIDPAAGGVGAYTTQDGFHCGGPINSPMPAIADVELTERWAPLLYLHRRIAQDSGGQGRSRGGAGLEIAVALSNVKEADALIMTHGLEVPNATGLGGGLPGATISQRMGKNVISANRYPKGLLPADPRSMGGRWSDLGPKPGFMKMTNKDVYLTATQGGGGLGDPLDRDPVKVLQDLDDGLISKSVATKIYGVAINRGQIDKVETTNRRRQIRKDRIGKTAKSKNSKTDDGWPLGEGLKLRRVSNQWRAECLCGHVLAKGSTQWRSGAMTKKITPPKMIAPLKLHKDLQMTVSYCPSCARQLSVDVHERRSPLKEDTLLDLKSIDKLRRRKNG